jgi:hypothetical protein
VNENNDPVSAEDQPESSKKSRRNLYLIIVAIVIVVGLVLLLTLTSSNSSTTTTTKPTKNTTTTTSKITATPQQQAVIATLSVANAAINTPKSATAPITSVDIASAASPDRPTLVVRDNLGDITGNPRMVALEWKFGAAPITTCVNIPRTRSTKPITLKTVACPAGLGPVHG